MSTDKGRRLQIFDYAHETFFPRNARHAASFNVF